MTEMDKLDRVNQLGKEWLGLRMVRVNLTRDTLSMANWPESESVLLLLFLPG